jgi:hypothetical protein
MDDYVDFGIAKKLKEKGFGELCLTYYTNDDILYYNYSHKPGASYKDCYLSHNLMPIDSVSGKFVDAPTISQVLKWLREEKTISVEPCATPYNCWYYMIKCKGEIKATYMDNKYRTYEQAAIAGIEYVLDNLI